MSGAPYGSSALLDAVEAALDAGDGLAGAVDARLAGFAAVDAVDLVELKRVEAELEFRRLIEAGLREKRSPVGQRVSKDAEAEAARALRLWRGPRLAKGDWYDGEDDG